jgi:hypothetical protein
MEDRSTTWTLPRIIYASTDTDSISQKKVDKCPLYDF